MVDDDLEVAVRAALVLERVLDLRDRALDLRMYTSSTARCGTLVGALKFDYGTAQDVARRDRVLLAAHARRGGTHFVAVCERRAVREPRGVTRQAS